LTAERISHFCMFVFSEFCCLWVWDRHMWLHSRWRWLDSTK